MLDKQTQKLMKEEQSFFGLVRKFGNFSPYPFGGMDQTSGRQSIKDNEFFLLENFIKSGEGKLRTLWDKGSALYTASSGKQIENFFFYAIETTEYVVVFLNDGTAYQVEIDNAAVTTISAVAGTFFNNSLPLTACAKWGSQYLILTNNITINSYYIWDGTLFYSAGSLGPVETIIDGGSGYTSVPTVLIYGGNGTGATATATITNGSVTDLQITNPGTGYQPGDQVQVLFTGGGSDDGAQLQAVLAAGGIQSITTTNGGTGYSASPVVTITGGGGSGATATATVVGGVITAINVTASGSGYTSTPSIGITDGTGSGALATALLTPATVASVTVVNGGTGFTGTPTITFVGGGGTGADFIATITGGVITSVDSNNHAPNNGHGSGYTSTPAVVVATGSNRAAAATVTLMPYGVSGSSIETFQQRVWLPDPASTGHNTNGGVFSVSAPGSLTDFATSDGGLEFTSTDSFLRIRYVNIKQSNGYLYPFGDSSVSVISNVQTTGNPSTTTFNYQNTDPQVGTSWRDSLQPYSRTILFANPFGVFGLYGGAVTKISSKVDDIFENAVFTGPVTPTAAVANLFNLKVYVINMTIQDPITEAQRTVMIGWDEKEWYIFSQTSSFTYIGSQEVNSDLFAWGTDGTSLYPLFTTPSQSLTKRLSTKLFGQNNFLTQKEAMGVYVQVQDLSNGATGVSFSSINVDTEHGTYPIPEIATFPSTPPPYFATVSMGSGDIFGVNLGLTMETNSEDFSLGYLGLGNIDTGTIAMGSTTISGQSQTE